MCLCPYTGVGGWSFPFSHHPLIFLFLVPLCIDSMYRPKGKKNDQKLKIVAPSLFFFLFFFANPTLIIQAQFWGGGIPINLSKRALASEDKNVLIAW